MNQKEELTDSEEAALQFDLTNEFHSCLRNSMQIISDKLEHVQQIISITESELSISYEFSILHSEISDYKRLFESILECSTHLSECLTGNRLLDARLSLFFSIANQFKTDDQKQLNYFNLVELICNSSTELVRFIQAITSKQDEQARAKTNFSIIDPNVFYNPSKILQKILFDKLNMFTRFKESGNKPASNMEITFNLIMTPKANNQPCFLLDVLDSDSAIGEQDEFSIRIKNVYIYNSYFELMSKTFQSTSKNVVNKLDLIKLTPMIDTPEKLGNMYKCVPFIDNESNQLICLVCIKFWQNKQSSLSNTISSSNDSKSTISPDENQSSCSSDAANDKQSTTNSASIPLNSPIYVYLSSFNQNFITQINSLLRF